jgi:diadenylate cyclase
MDLVWTIQSIDSRAVIDILLVALLIFAGSFLVRGTQTLLVLRGIIVVIVVIGLLSSILNLVAFNWVLRGIITMTTVAIPIIFQPELRRAFERLGRASFGFRQNSITQREMVVNVIAQAAGRLSERRHGALIVLERQNRLDEFINTGVPLDSEITPQLLLTVFWPKTELHDGAVIVRGDRVMAAACVLPLSSGRNLGDRKLGTRHRASLGMSEVSDAIVVTVSEETGQISVSNGGRMIRRLDANRLTTILLTFYGANVEDAADVLPLRNGSLERLRRLIRLPNREGGTPR